MPKIAETRENPNKHPDTDILGKQLRSQISAGLEAAIRSTQNTDINRCNYCCGTKEEVRGGVLCPCRCLTTLD